MLEPNHEAVTISDRCIMIADRHLHLESKSQILGRVRQTMLETSPDLVNNLKHATRDGSGIKPGMPVPCKL